MQEGAPELALRRRSSDALPEVDKASATDPPVVVPVEVESTGIIFDPNNCTRFCWCDRQDYPASHAKRKQVKAGGPMKLYPLSQGTSTLDPQ